VKPKHLRLAFLPTPASREYFEDLIRRLTWERGLGIRVTQREAFDQMVQYARVGEHPKRQALASLLKLVK
jgi:hypothetical protein